MARRARFEIGFWPFFGIALAMMLVFALATLALLDAGGGR